MWTTYEVPERYKYTKVTKEYQMNKSISSDGRIQSNGWSVGKKTTRRKTSINLDEDIGRVLEKRSEDSGLLISRLINDSLRTHFGLTI
jgi:hypothetical protein|tara:strand:+ start:444 stop:707 length:264 start_codon:yes stop_codon:yes gene_type:complete